MREWNSNSEHVNFSLPFTMWASSQPPESVILVRCEFQLLLSLSSDTFWEEEYIVQIREAPEEMASPIPYSNTPVSFTSEVHPQHSLCTRTLNILTKISFLKKKKSSSHFVSQPGMILDTHRCRCPLLLLSLLLQWHLIPVNLLSSWEHLSVQQGNCLCKWAFQFLISSFSTMRRCRIVIITFLSKVTRWMSFPCSH